MSDYDVYIGPGVAGGVILFLRWAMNLWATIRREDIMAAKETATAQREAEIRITDRQVAAIDRIAARVDEHTAKDLAHHADVREAVVRVEAKVDSALAWQDRSGTVMSEASERTKKLRSSTPAR